MRRERKGSSSEESGASSSGESSGSDSSASQKSKDSKRIPKKDTSSSKTKSSDDTAPGRGRRGGDDDSKERNKKKEGTGNLSSSDGEHVPRAGPRSTVIQKVSSETKDKDRKKEESDRAIAEVDNGKSDKREDPGGSHSKKRSHSKSPRNKDISKRWKEDRSSGRGSDRREDRRPHRNIRDYDWGRSWRAGDRRRMDSRRRDEDCRGDGSRHDADKDRYDRKRDRDSDKSDRRIDQSVGERRKDREDRDKDRGSRREENKENKKNENMAEGQKRKSGEAGEGEKEKVESAPPEKKAKEGGTDITTRTGGAYIPPAKLRMMQQQITDKSSVEYQRMAWEALKKSINGLVNKVNVSNIVDIVREMFQENIVRGRGLLARSVIQAQAASPTFTHVYAALVAIINTKFPQIGELILTRLILQFKRGFRRNDKNQCLSSTRFVAHLVNQQVAHEVVALEILTLLLENVTEDAVEVAISFLKECGQNLTEVSPRGISAIFERLRSILHEAQLDKRVQYMVEVMFAVRKDGFKAHPAIIGDLDLVEEDDQFTHLLQLDDVTAGQEQLNVFKADNDYLQNEERYMELKKEILAEGSSDEGGSGEESGSDDSDDDEDDEEKEEGKQDIIDQTETNMVALRRTIYLTIQSSLDFEECAHKLLKMDLKPGQEMELCYMILDCSSQLRTYEKFFGLLAQRFCQLDRKYVAPFQTIFREQFETIHRLDTNKLRNVAKLFAHLLHTDAISWEVMSCMKLTEEDTTSASRIFIKILFLELSEYMGLPKLNNRLRDPTLQVYFEGILPRNNPKDTRFAINFFTTIGLGGLTEDLREHLKGISKQLMQNKQQQEQLLVASSSSDSSDTGSSDSDSSDSSESGSSDSSDTDSEDSDSSSDLEQEQKRKKSKAGKTPATSKVKSSHSQHIVRQAMRHNNRQDLAVGWEKRDDGRSRIEDKLLQMSLPKGMSLVDPSAVEPDESPFRKNHDKSKKNRGVSIRGDRRAPRRRQNLERKRRQINNVDHGADRDAVFFRGEREGHGLAREDLIAWGREELSMRGRIMDREDGGRGRPMTPPLVRRQHPDSYNIMDGRGGRRDLTPPGRGGLSRWDSDRGDLYFQQRVGDRMDMGMSPPTRGGDRHILISPPPVRHDRQDFDDFPPPPRIRLEVDEGPPRLYDRLDVDMDSRYEVLPRGQRSRHDALTPPPLRMGRREIESPPSRRMDSPPRHLSHMDGDRGREEFARGRGDLERTGDRGRSDMDRGRGDVDRVRGEIDRLRGDMDRGRGDADRGLDHGGRREVDRPREDMDRMVADRRDMERGNRIRRSLERGRGDIDWDRDFDSGVDRARNMDRRMDIDHNGGRGWVDLDRGNVSRSAERGRGDVDRGRDMERGRSNVDRREVDHEVDRGRGDRGRMDSDRGREDVDKGRMVDRDRDVNRSRGRPEPDSPMRQNRREQAHSPPLAKHRDMSHSAEGDRRHFRDADDKGSERSESPPARKENVQERNNDSSLSLDKKERQKASHRNEEEGRRERNREKRHR